MSSKGAKGSNSKAGMAKSALKFVTGGEPGVPRSEAALGMGRDAGEAYVGGAIGIYEFWPRVIARGIQFVVALIAAGFYGGSLNSDEKTSSDAFWYFALFVVAASCITSIVYNIPGIKSARCFAWDFTLAVLWIATFGIFATMFLNEDGDKHKGVSVTAMKIAMVIDVLCCLLWLITGAWGVVRTFCVDWLKEKGDRVQAKAGGKMGGYEMNARNKAKDKFNSKFPGSGNKSDTESVSLSDMEEGHGGVQHVPEARNIQDDRTGRHGQHQASVGAFQAAREFAGHAQTFYQNDHVQKFVVQPGKAKLNNHHGSRYQ